MVSRKSRATKARDPKPNPQASNPRPTKSNQAGRARWHRRSGTDSQRAPESVEGATADVYFFGLDDLAMCS